MLGKKFDEHRRYREMFSERLDGRLAPDSEAELQQHLAGCISCRRSLEELRETVTMLQALPDQEEPRSFAIKPVPQATPPSSRLGLPSLAMRVATVTAALALAVAVFLDAGGLTGHQDGEAPLNFTAAGRSEEKVMAPEEAGAPADDSSTSEVAPRHESDANQLESEDARQVEPSPPPAANAYEAPAPPAAATVSSREAGETEGGLGTLRWIEIVLGGALGLLVLGNVLIFLGRRSRVSE